MSIFSALRRSLIRNIDADLLLDNFLIAAVSTLFFIRFYLFLTGYPQLGGNGLHIAHMLWGGFLMLFAIILMLVYLGRSIRSFAAVIGGIGFGTFIDELGKFVTSDNNYFFQPTIALLYFIFIVLYLFIRHIDRYRPHADKEYLVNALELIKDAVENDMDRHEMHVAKEYLKKCDPDNPLALDLKNLLSRVELTPTPPGNIFTRARRLLHGYYLDVIGHRLFLKTVLLIFGINALLTLGQALLLLYALLFDKTLLGNFVSDLSVAYIVQIISSSVAAFFVIIGAYRLRHNRLAAFRLFRLSILLQIFFTQFFAFYQLQFYALSGLFANIFLLGIIHYLITEEEGNVKRENG